MGNDADPYKFSSQKVAEFGRRLYDNPLECLALTDALIRGYAVTGPAASILWTFDHLSPFEKVAAVDELRSAMSDKLSELFMKFNDAARKAAEERDGA